MDNEIKKRYEANNNDVPIRVNKYLSEAGVCSRREADRLIEKGCVTVDGIPAVAGMKILKSQRIQINGKDIVKQEKMIFLAFHKPKGIVCTSEKMEKNNIIDYLQYPERVFPVGRLDKDSEGLILLTNNGDIVNKMMRSGNQHEKEYIVTVDKPITADFIKTMASGVPILDTVTRKCKATQVNKYQFNIVLTQGLNRQIRRMCEYCGYRVTKLVRIRIMNITLGNLKVGTYRNVTEKEMKELSVLIKDSSNETVIKEKANESQARENERTHRNTKSGK